MILEQYRTEYEADREEHDKLLAEMRESMPDHQRVLTLLRDREEKAKQMSRLEMRLIEFGIVKENLVNSDCVRFAGNVVEPSVPIKPNRPMLIGFGLFASIGLGIALVCLLEYIDHSVKVPEHVTHGLTLPLLGVVPRIRRTALTHRGGHLWTPGTPDSIEADAYRNVRASLLGITDKRGSIVTLLVTSAKAGEGKSTTALNLAATAPGPASGRCSWTSTSAGPAWPTSSSSPITRARSTGSSTSSGASCRGNEPFAIPRFPTSTSSRPETPAISRSRSWALSSCGNC